MTPELTRLRELFGDQAAAEVLRPDRPKKARKRPVPQMRRHAYGWARISFKVRGKRRVIYLGPWNSDQARARYAAFAKRWPAQLNEPPTRGKKWPKVRLLMFRGRRMSLAKWAREVGISASALKWRLDRLRWTVSKALTTPKQAPRFSKPSA